MNNLHPLLLQFTFAKIIQNMREREERDREERERIKKRISEIEMNKSTKKKEI